MSLRGLEIRAWVHPNQVRAGCLGNRADLAALPRNPTFKVLYVSIRPGWRVLLRVPRRRQKPPTAPPLPTQNTPARPDAPQPPVLWYVGAHDAMREGGWVEGAGRPDAAGKGGAGGCSCRRRGTRRHPATRWPRPRSVPAGGSNRSPPKKQPLAMSAQRPMQPTAPPCLHPSPTSLTHSGLHQSAGRSFLTSASLGWYFAPSR